MLSLGIDVGGTRVKGALLRDGVLVAQHAAAPYERASFDVIEKQIREVVDVLHGDRTPGARLRGDAVGVRVRGVLDQDPGRVRYSANLPGLTAHDLRFLAFVAGGANAWVLTATDQIAAATDSAPPFDMPGFRIDGR